GWSGAARRILLGRQGTTLGMRAATSHPNRTMTPRAAHDGMVRPSIKMPWEAPNMFRRGDRGGRGGDGPGANTYQMKQKIMAIGDDFWIENGAGQRVYKVDVKALRIRKTLHLQDHAGNDNELFK